MATPVTTIKKKKKTEEETRQEKLAELQSLIADQEQALNKILEITGELEDIGVLDALQAMVKAKEDIAKIALAQVSREPFTNLINHVINTSNAISAIDPEVTAKLVDGIQSGLREAEADNDNLKVGVFQLMKALNDPDINRAIKFGMNFLKGMGKELGDSKKNESAL